MWLEFERSLNIRARYVRRCLMGHLLAKSSPIKTPRGTTSHQQRHYYRENPLRHISSLNKGIHSVALNTYHVPNALMDH
ncbi:MAG: hypothetical protein LZF60_270012 [Nitrospira sp.]|nr:MAG: hypothetical protein LZF60_270012 [Nitrospira sp.]